MKPVLFWMLVAAVVLVALGLGVSTALHLDEVNRWITSMGIDPRGSAVIRALVAAGPGILAGLLIRWLFGKHVKKPASDPTAAPAKPTDDKGPTK